MYTNDNTTPQQLYDSMVKVLSEPNTLHYRSAYHWYTDEYNLGSCVYDIWMKKPGYARMEAISTSGDNPQKVCLVMDGENCWIYWPEKRLQWGGIENDEDYEASCRNVYMSEPAPAGRISIAHTTDKLGVGMAMTILEPSVFHGVQESMHFQITGIESLGEESVNGEVCDVIAVHYLDGQRVRTLSLSRRDHLPRYLKQVVRVEHDIIFEETWSDIAINQEINDDKFKWTPPDGWREWKLPEGPKLLESGTEAPDFEMLLINGGTIKLSDLRGKVVWLIGWRVGCPPCREEIPYLETIHQKYSSRELVVLGLNTADDKKIVNDFLEQHSVSFPNILDHSDEVRTVVLMQYGINAVPTNYLIDRDGRIVESWLGYEDGDDRGEKALAAAGIVDV